MPHFRHGEKRTNGGARIIIHHNFMCMFSCESINLLTRPNISFLVANGFLLFLPLGQTVARTENMVDSLAGWIGEKYGRCYGAHNLIGCDWLTDWLMNRNFYVLCFSHIEKMWQKRQLWQLWRERACERNSLLKRNVLTGNLNNKTTCKNWMHIYHNFLSGCAEQRHHHFRRLGISFASFLSYF